MNYRDLIKSIFRVSLQLLILLLTSTTLLAQNKEKKTKDLQKVVRDTLKINQKPKFWYLPSAVRVGTDLTDIGKTIIGGGDYKGFELRGDIDILNRFFLVANYGYENRRINSEGNIRRYTKVGTNVESEIIANYAAESRYQGHFVRFGFDYNLTPRNPDHTMIYLGLRYGLSNFDQYLKYVETVNTSTPNPSPWGDVNSEIDGKGYQLTWYEIVAGLKVNVYKNFYLGSALEIKFGKTIKGGDKRIIPTKAPGNSHLRKGTNVEFSVTAAYRIPFRKGYLPPPKPKK